MSHLDIIRAWKNAEFRSKLSAGEAAMIPEHPAGVVELTDEHLGCVVGGSHPDTRQTVTNNDICCCSGCACL